MTTTNPKSESTLPRCEATQDQISPERIKILSGLGKPQNPAERKWQSDFVKRCGYDQWPRETLKTDHFEHDYEGAILARQEAEQF